jgi:competence protein ComEA
VARRTGDAGIYDRLTRLVTARGYVPLSLAVMVVLLIGLIAGTLVRSGRWPLAIAQPHPTVAITGPGVDVPATLQAMVLGAVRSPSRYTLPAGAHVADLIEVAGGVLTSADLTRVNLTATLADGQSVYVPLKDEVVPFERGGKIDLNAASADELHRALGISLTIARRIVAYRAAHGAFGAVSQLLLVPVSKTTYDRIKDLVIT